MTPKCVEINNFNVVQKFELSGLSILCVSCNNLKSDSEKITCSFDAKAQEIEVYDVVCMDKIKESLQNSEALLCKFCNQSVAKTR